MKPVKARLDTFVREWLGTPFVPHGRSREEGVDCWGLVVSAYREVLGVELPSYAGEYEGEDTLHPSEVIEAAVKRYLPEWDAVETTPRAMDVALLELKGRPVHVGLMLDRRRFFHVEQGIDACVEKIDDPRWSSRLHGIVRRRVERGVTVTACPHPLSTERSVIPMSEGLTIEQMVRAAVPDPVTYGYVHAFANGRTIPREWWPRVRPKAGFHLEIRVVPMGGGGGGGGGKNPLRTILTIAVMAASFTFGPSVGSFLFGRSASAAVIGSVTAGALGTAITGAVGLLLVNAVAPVRPPGLGRLSGSDRETSNTYFVEGSRNRANPFGPVPVILGRHRVSPQYGAQPVTEVIGGEHFVRLLFVVGHGPLSIDTGTFKIGETALSNFDGVEYEVREGYASDTALTLFPDTISQDDLSVTLHADKSLNIRTTGANVDEISIDLTFPQGLCWLNPADGQRYSIYDVVRVWYRKVGTSTWQAPTFTAKTFPDAWISSGTTNKIRFVHGSLRPIRHGVRWSTGERAQYEVLVVREPIDPSSRVSHIGSFLPRSNDIVDTLVWTALRTITNEDPIDPPVPMAKVAVLIKATEQLNNVVDEFNLVATSVGYDYDSGTGSWLADQEIQNPASLFRLVLDGNGSASPLSSSRIDLDELADWHTFCETKGFEFNQVRDFRTSQFNALLDVAAAGRAAPNPSSGKFGVVVEEEQTTVVSHITPRNSYDFRIQRLYDSFPHAWRIRFPNENQDYRQDERIVYRDGYTSANATLFETLELPGVTNSDQVYRLGRYRIAQVIQQAERWSWGQDMEYLTYERGDRVAITHDVLQAGTASGRVKSVTVNGSNEVTTITVDEVCTMVGGTNYGIVVRTVDSGLLTKQVVTDPGDHTTLTLSTPIAAVAGQPAINADDQDIFGFGELDSETDDAWIVSIVPESDFRARAEAVPYRPAIFDADTEVIPPFTTNLTALPVIPTPTIRSTEASPLSILASPSDRIRASLTVEINPLDDPRLDNPRIEVQGKLSAEDVYFPAEVLEQYPNRVVLGGLHHGETWDFRLRFVVDSRLPGGWAETADNQIALDGVLPPSPTGFTGERVRGAVKLEWSAQSFPFAAGYEIRENTEVNTADPLTAWDEGTVLVTGLNATRFERADYDSSTKQYLIRALDSLGNYSEENDIPWVKLSVPTTKGTGAYPFAFQRDGGMLLLFDRNLLTTQGQGPVENTGDEPFLHHGFGRHLGGATFEEGTTQDIAGESGFDDGNTSIFSVTSGATLSVGKEYAYRSIFGAILDFGANTEVDVDLDEDAASAYPVGSWVSASATFTPTEALTKARIEVYSDGGTGLLDYIELEAEQIRVGAPNWIGVSYQIVEGDPQPLSDIRMRLTFTGVAQTEVYLDNLQIEQKEHPTTFTNSSRGPGIVGWRVPQPNMDHGLISLDWMLLSTISESSERRFLSWRWSGVSGIQIKVEDETLSALWIYGSGTDETVTLTADLTGIISSDGAVGYGVGPWGWEPFGSPRPGTGVSFGTGYHQIQLVWDVDEFETTWTLKLYLDGRLVDTDTAGGKPTSMADAPLFLGGYDYVAGGYLNGILDNVLVLPYTPAESEVLDYYHSGLPFADENPRITVGHDGKFTLLDRDVEYGGLDVDAVAAIYEKTVTGGLFYSNSTQTKFGEYSTTRWDGSAMQSLTFVNGANPLHYYDWTISHNLGYYPTFQLYLKEAYYFGITDLTPVGSGDPVIRYNPATPFYLYCSYIVTAISATAITLRIVGGSNVGTIPAGYGADDFLLALFKKDVEAVL